jgi:hypothetical protein
MPARPRQRLGKKLMTIAEVNERFPLSTYKNWVASRAREGLPMNGSVAITAPPIHAASLKEADAIIPTSMADVEHPDNSALSVSSQAEVATTEDLGKTAGERDSTEATTIESVAGSLIVEEHHGLQEVQPMITRLINTTLQEEGIRTRTKLRMNTFTPWQHSQIPEILVPFISTH